MNRLRPRCPSRSLRFVTRRAQCQRQALPRVDAQFPVEGLRFALHGKVFYFHAPEGVARSKAFSRIEKSLGVAGTARNWRTACRILRLAEQMESDR